MSFINAVIGLFGSVCTAILSVSPLFALAFLLLFAAVFGAWLYLFRAVRR